MKKKIVLEGSGIADKKELFHVISIQINHPEFKAHNLDALHDALGDLKTEQLELVIHDPDQLKTGIGERYFKKLLQVFYDQKIGIYLLKL